ncbi:dethiobiotin synthase [Nitrosomonas sp. Nm166]|uniref:dethiobiotin synthase n=1 Tax=Nitrosomonas sp. Nm166 TaxID=1881054 RepID=UPI0008E5C322|nr:dethiobiotin synthase [Nitrosomonas sp. Nm166]SFE88651.1 dethiobiotin synthetase [Nitrosomonas sp. Nm166]
MSAGFFVTGTDTGIGKTTISCALLYAFAAQDKKVVGMKPIAAGSENGQWIDVERLLAASNVSVSRQLMNSYAFDSPISPHIAAQQAGTEISMAVIHQAYQELSTKADIVIVEGAGGFLVPINQWQSGADLAQTLNLPVILVVGMRLGCLNHALLTAQAIQAAGLVLAGWVANCMDPQMLALIENIKTLKQQLKCPLIGILPFTREMDIQQSAQLLDIKKLVIDHQSM